MSTITVKSGESIQSAGINSASPGDTVEVKPGTYNETLTLDVNGLTLKSTQGSGQTTLRGSGGGDGIDVQADNITVDGFKIENYGNGISFDAPASNPSLRNLKIQNNSPRGIEIHNNADLTDLSIESVNITSNSDGIRKATSGEVDGLTINNSSLDGNSGSGLEFYTNDTSPSTGDLKNVRIENTTFNKNNRKGIYTETLDGATFKNISVVDSGTAPSNSANAGIDINLKYGDYSGDIKISNSTVSGVKKGNQFNKRAAVGITIKARQDSSYGSNPATLTGAVTLTNLTVKDNQNGIRFGEAGASVFGLESNPRVKESNINDNSNFGITNEISSVTVDATNSWWGAADGPSGGSSDPSTGTLANGDGDKVSSGVRFDPWNRHLDLRSGSGDVSDLLFESDRLDKDNKISDASGDGKVTPKDDHELAKLFKEGRLDNLNQSQQDKLDIDGDNKVTFDDFVTKVFQRKGLI